ncbi:MAG: hypothetical protein CMM48_04865 [Rhodospirillaceae bacterium]|nr:hypothetical protein [Rhodospirillaceae bacterium]|tara:strand:+ start:73 stop:525 length:453 start_codon:yes stop_codon:yes gene_type:complete
MRSVSIAIALVLIAMVSAIAHEGAVGVVAERMATMKNMGAAMKQIKAMIKGRADYDAARVEELARAIAAHSGEKMTSLFPQGSDEKPAQTKPAVWSDWQRFRALADDLQQKAIALANAAGSAATAKSPYRAVSKNCRSCHKKFRKKRKRH